MINYKKDNKYLLSYSTKFIKDFNLNHINFIEWIKIYIKDFYLKNKPQMYSNKVYNWIVRFHKADIKDNNKSSKKAKRVIVFFILNEPNWINTIYPAFCFWTQEEKIYNIKLKSKNFVKELILKFQKYNKNNDNIIEI